MTQHNPDREDDWGGSTDWQRPAEEAPRAGHGWAPPPGNPPQQGYGVQGYGAQGYAGQPGYGPPPAHQPAPSWPQQPGWPSAAPPPNYLVQAILVTLFCFLPTGGAAIYYSSQVANRHNVGDYAGAVDASNKAKMWCWISLAVGAVLWLIVVATASTGSGSYY